MNSKLASTSLSRPCDDPHPWLDNDSDHIAVSLGKPRVIRVDGFLPGGDVREYHLKVTNNHKLVLL